MIWRKRKSSPITSREPHPANAHGQRFVCIDGVWFVSVEDTVDYVLEQAGRHPDHADILRGMALAIGQTVIAAEADRMGGQS